MNKKTSTALLIFLIAALVGTYVVPTMKHNRENKIKSDYLKVKELIKTQALDWNNGDLDGYMSLYLKSDSLPFLTQNGVNYGWKRLYDSYKKRYFENEQAKGRLNFEIEKVIPIEYNTCLVPGSWAVTFEDTVLSGRFSLLFKNFDKDGWKIIADHTW